MIQEEEKQQEKENTESSSITIENDKQVVVAGNSMVTITNYRYTIRHIQMC
jgi:hypothetical protein